MLTQLHAMLLVTTCQEGALCSGTLMAGVEEITVFFKLLGVEKEEHLKLLQNEGPRDIYYMPGSWISTVEWH